MIEKLHALLWAKVEPSLYITREQYIAGLEGWTLTPHDVRGVWMGIALTKGSEFHFVTLGEKWRLTRRDIRRYLEPILVEHGVVTTQTLLDDTRQQRFNELIGFERVKEDEYYVHYALKRLSFVKDTSCQS